MAWLRLIRWPNLLIIALTQFMVWWRIIRPLENLAVLKPGAFAMLSLSTVLIAAGGYIINDYFDIRIDAINKPERVILEKAIPRRLAIIFHSLLNFVALLLAARVALPAGHPEWLLIQIACMAMLWRYSTAWKRQFMIGNMMVAIMTALTVLVLLIYEPGLYRFGADSAMIYRGKFGWRVNPVYVLAVFAIFAFMLTWMREIVKDMEDFKGDEAEGCLTMPIKWGLLRSSRFVQLLAVITLFVLVYVAGRLFGKDFRSLDLGLYIVLVLVPALTVWMLRLPLKATSRHYHQSSTQLKLIMVAGVVALFVYHH